MTVTKDKTFCRLLLACALLTTAACQSRPPSPEEGVYTSSREVFIFHAEVLELAQGRFRYWFRSDVKTSEPETWPITGTYRLDGDRIYFDTSNRALDSRLIVDVSGSKCLLRSDAEQGWRQPQRETFPYGWLIRVPYRAEQMWPGERYDPKVWEAIAPRLPTLKDLKLQPKLP